MKVAKFTGTNYKYRDINSLPFPDYEPFGIDEMLDEYSYATRVLYRYSRIDPRPYNLVASRSCPFTCTFCVHQRRGIPYRARSIENVMGEIRESYEKYHFNVLIIFDELFGNKKRLVEFSNAVLDGKEKYGWDFDWIFQTHANARFDADSLKLAKKAGCYVFSYGLESASPVVLKSMDKKLDVSRVVEVIKMAEEVGIGFAANLIFGDIAETVHTVAESLAFWFSYGRRSNIFLGELKPYPGSKLFESCQQKGLFKDKRAYYENINNLVVNMTDIPDDMYVTIMALINNLEAFWLFAQSSSQVKCSVEKVSGLFQTYMGKEVYRIDAECPYCGQAVSYKEQTGGFPFWLGTGCTKCHRKIKLEVK